MGSRNSLPSELSNHSYNIQTLGIYSCVRKQLVGKKEVEKAKYCDVESEEGDNECFELKGNLVGPLYDQNQINGFFMTSKAHQKTYTLKQDYILSHDGLHHYQKKDLINGLKKLFDSPDKDATLLFISSHGEEQDGNVLLEVVEKSGNAIKPITSTLSYDEIANLWLKRDKKNKNKYLLIVIDACFSGKWVEKRNKNYHLNENIYIQASSQSNQASTDMGITSDLGKGGLFIYCFIMANQDKYNKIKAIESKVKQQPCSTGEIFEVWKIFNLRCMVDSFSEYLNFSNFTISGGYFGCWSFLWGKNGKGVEYIDTNEYYEGIWYHGKKSGKGKYQYSNGDIYFGDWKEDMKHGAGVYYFHNGNIYDGEWSQNEIAGNGKLIKAPKDKAFRRETPIKFTIFSINTKNEKVPKDTKKSSKSSEDCFMSKSATVYRNSSCFISNENAPTQIQMCAFSIHKHSQDIRYSGEYMNGKKSGTGVFIYSEKKRYEGSWKTDMRDGYGILYMDKKKYKGEWSQNMKHGYGEYTYCNGDIYYGQWKNNKKEGFGCYFYNNGDCYSGLWFNNQKNGYGTYKSKSGSVYRCGWRNGRKEGVGEVTLFNGESYKGEWLNDQKEGYGEYFYSNGSVFKGDWKGNKKQGIGVLLTSMGDYLGEFKFNMFTGTGTIFYTENFKQYCFRGEFANNQRNGYGCLYVKYPHGIKSLNLSEKTNRNYKLIYSGNWKEDRLKLFS